MTEVTSRLRAVWADAARSRMPLPPEKDLAVQLGVSRPTLREALARMEAQGLIRRDAHRGTFPNVVALDLGLRIDESFEFSAGISEAGFEPSIQLISSGWIRMDAELAGRHSLPEGTVAFEMTKRWCAGGTPVMYAIDHIPMTRESVALPDARTSIFQLVRDLRGETVEWESARLRARSATAQDGDMLLAEAGKPLIQLDITGVSRSGEVLYVAQEVHRDDVIPYHLVRSSR
ncbi:GntR family transcriptional regulator [Kineosporia succinea]|uniref:GntR family transcriptional regulator n=1 Tax=Kineosporia succinea TaxID=84632 RepID=A0ABT9PBP3_9ACTN|nr:GntR family transcriptional regulator [Kineosporia succinea]MDP9829814.1 GntR family transcriptional regulator [Kineosporia succinea]